MISRRLFLKAAAFALGLVGIRPQFTIGQTVDQIEVDTKPLADALLRAKLQLRAAEWYARERMAAHDRHGELKKWTLEEQAQQWTSEHDFALRLIRGSILTDAACWFLSDDRWDSERGYFFESGTVYFHFPAKPCVLCETRINGTVSKACLNEDGEGYSEWMA